MAELLKLNIGAGGKDLPGFTPWDRRDGHEGYPLPQDAGTVAEIYASHVLEHFRRDQIQPALLDWFRVLAPGGRLRVAVPDFDRVIEAYITKTTGAPIQGWLHGGQTDPNDVHYASFTEPMLRQLLTAAGFVDIETWQAEIDDCAALPISLNLCGRKPDLVPVPKPPLGVPYPPDFHDHRRRFQDQLVAIAHARGQAPEPAQPFRKVKTAAVWSTGRLGFMSTFGCIFQALPTLGIPLVRGFGAYWGQSLELAMRNAIRDHDPEYLVSLDYDSLFTPTDLAAEIAIMDAHPEVDALCPYQWHRTENKPLYTPLRNDDGTFKVLTEADLETGLVEIGTGHFGLTVIRTAVLARMPRPWFLAHPAPDGSWESGRLDDDMYFWYLFGECGNHLYLASKVAIGHQVEDIVWPHADHNHAVRQGMFEYFATGKPAGVFGGH